jgi:hypothetical protein
MTSLLTKVTVPPAVIVTVFGLTPLDAMAMRAVAGAGAGVGAGPGVGDGAGPGAGAGAGAGAGDTLDGDVGVAADPYPDPHPAVTTQAAAITHPERTFAAGKRRHAPAPALDTRMVTISLVFGAGWRRSMTSLCLAHVR